MKARLLSVVPFAAKTAGVVPQRVKIQKMHGLSGEVSQGQFKIFYDICLYLWPFLRP